MISLRNIAIAKIAIVFRIEIVLSLPYFPINLLVKNSITKVMIRVIIITFTYLIFPPYFISQATVTSPLNLLQGILSRVFLLIL